MGSICKQLAVVATAEEGLHGRNVLSIHIYFYYADCSQILLVSVGSLVRYKINKLKCYYPAQYIAHVISGAHTVYVYIYNYVLKSSHVFGQGSACMWKLISRTGRLFQYLVRIFEC